MNDITLNPKIIQKAEQALSQSNHFLEIFVTEWDETKNNTDDIDSQRLLQLVLQYRLDTQSALRQLLRLQQDLLQLLGIEKQHSVEENLERMAFALGSDDLHHILSLLNQLADSLLRIIAQNLAQQTLDRKKAKERLKKTKLIDTMVQAIEQQKTFILTTEEISLALEDIEGAPQPGIVYDHLAALEGPISRFEQALQHGLILSNSVFQQLQKKSNLNFQLTDLLNKTEQVLHASYHPEHQRLFTPSLEKDMSQRLEERASAKRLGHFFRY